jgi:glycosyltransferase involved in cell wall biosynthesis
MEIYPVKISCVIPAYNESEHILNVLKVVSKIDCFEEVIVVDDGSKDNTVKVVQDQFNNFKKIKLIVNKENLGKTATIVRGVEESKGDLIVMLDSDLINLSEKNIKNLIQPLIDNEYDLTILDRAGDRKAAWGWTNCARFFGGERAIWKKDFNELKFPKSGGYLLEICMNLQFILWNKKIKTIYCPNLYTYHHYNKEGFFEGYKHYILMSSKIIKTATFSGFVKQFFKIEEDRLEKLYRIHNKIPLRPLTGLLIIFSGFMLGLITFVELNIIDIPIPHSWLKFRKSVKNKTRYLKNNTKKYMDRSREVWENYHFFNYKDKKNKEK